MEDMKSKEDSGHYVADRTLTQGVIGLLEEVEARDTQPELIFAISMEGHGPWGNQPNLPENELQEIQVPGLLTKEAEKAFRQFFYHLGNADTELGRISEYLRSRDRPTVLLFFGDHLPGLGSVFKQLGFKNSKRPREQETVYLLISNQPLGATIIPETITAWQLSTYLLKSLGLLADSQFAWFDSLYDTVDAHELLERGCREGESCRALREFQLEQLNQEIQRH